MDDASDNSIPGYEIADASVRGVVLGLLLVAGCVLTTLAVVRLMMLGPENAPSAFGNTGIQASFTHGTQQHTSVEDSWTAIDRELAQHIDGYGWIDREQGIVRIPVSRAMDLIVEEETARK